MLEADWLTLISYAGDFVMMHFIYEFANEFPIETYNSLQGWLLDRWVVKYALDVKRRTGYLAQEVMKVYAGRLTGLPTGGKKRWL